MKKLYWRPRGISRSVLVAIAVISLGGLVSVESIGTRRKHSDFGPKLQAARVALDAMHVIKAERLKRGIQIDPELDPAESGLIGSLMSPVTTATGHLPAKQTSVNPNFAAVVAEMLRKAGAKPGDIVAVGCSGSFPALNVCVYAACRALRLKPIVVSSASASQFGANDPNLLWIDMERILYDRDKEEFAFRSVAASLGGVEDRAVGLAKSGVAMLTAAIERNGIAMIKSKRY